MGRRSRTLKDIAWKYCSKIDDNNSSHILCNFCGHTMWGITRFKEHLAQKKGDVIACDKCPSNVRSDIQHHLIDKTRVREMNQRLKRQKLEDLKKTTSEEVPQLTSQINEENEEAIDEEEERVLLEKAMKASLSSHEEEKIKMKKLEDEFKAACQESACYYREMEMWKSGEGCSNIEAGDVIDLCYDSDGFSI
ncbi:Zinc finger, BED-type domain containing protein [Quillaja saponaria]|uniref:Zinc finger, BED-type domain containing protein n=1 Tax=Quillaja saponaria TaxID=32244 RepID=A0AAD7VKR8_QUISA|nr:Zinc finger, BED-type domain containing protein [Quillaja saponaria]